MADATGVGICAINDKKDNNGSRVNIITSTYTNLLLVQHTYCLLKLII